MKITDTAVEAACIAYEDAWWGMSHAEKQERRTNMYDALTAALRHMEG